MKIFIFNSICLSAGKKFSEQGDGINMLRAEKHQECKMVSAYLREVKNLIRGDNFEGALKTLDKALTEHPLNAFLLSYYGYVDATVNNNFERGIGLCKTAVDIIEDHVHQQGGFTHSSSS